MRRLNFTVLSLVAVVILFMSSCEKKALVNEIDSINQDEVSYLEFANKADFEEALKTESSTVRSESFVSMYDVFEKISITEDINERNTLIEKYKDILKIDEDGIVDLIIVDDVFASFLSPEGLVKVGNEISLVEKDKIKTITDGDVSKIELLSQIEEDSPENNIRIDEFIQVVQTDKAYWSGEDKWRSNRKDYKLKWEKWASYSPFNSSAGGKVRSYKKRLGVYTAHSTSLVIHISWNYIEWGKDHSTTWWNYGHIQDSKSGWSLSERKYKGSGWTPNPVYGLKVWGSVGGHSFSH